MVVDKEEELQARVSAGWRLKRDAKGFRIWDPKTGTEERVSADLEDVAAKIYARQKYEKVREKLEKGVEGGLEGDLAYIIGMIRTKVDSRAPILQKWAEDILWWQHVLSDTTTKILPDLLARLRVEEIDLEDPEKTAEALVKHYVELRTAAQGAEALRQKYEEEIRARDEKIKMLEDRLKLLQDAYEGLGKLCKDFATRTKMTLDFFLRQIPPYLPRDAQETYRLIASKVQKIWEGMNVEQ